MAFESLATMSSTSLNSTLRFVHANGASLFFIFMYYHIGRGLYFGSFRKKHTWQVGVTILLLTIATAFLGYVLPWGQMSFWGASVIVGLISAIPALGNSIAAFLWGGMSVTDRTANRFFTLHFLLPFILSALVLIHLAFLHTSGSRNPTGSISPRRNLFINKYATKDAIGVLCALIFLIYLASFEQDTLGDPENFTLANPAVTPMHIIPEWYYLFAYAILRAIPRKLGGVVALVLRITVLYTLPLTSPDQTRNTPIFKFVFWAFIVITSALTWIGAKPVEEPYVFTSQILSTLYFSYFFIIILK